MRPIDLSLERVREVAPQLDDARLEIVEEIRDGMQVEARALVTLYEPRGRFQLIEAMIPRGVLSSTLQRFVGGVKRLTVRTG